MMFYNHNEVPMITKYQLIMSYLLFTKYVYKIWIYSQYSQPQITRSILQFDLEINIQKKKKKKLLSLIF